MKFTNLQISKILNTNGIYIASLKNNSAVNRSSYLYTVNQKFSLANALFFFQNQAARMLRYFTEIYMKRSNNPLLSKSRLK